MTPEMSELLTEFKEAKWAALIFSLAGGILSMIAGAIVSYSKEKGKHWATEENFRSILAQAKETEASKESAKIDGIHANLKKLVEQVEAVTTKTEEIKHRIGNEIWLQQTLRNEKRAIYADLCKIVGGLIHNCEEMKRVAQKIHGNSPEYEDDFKETMAKLKVLLAHGETEPGNEVLHNEVLPLVEQRLVLTRNLHESRIQLRIYCHPAAILAFDEFIAPELGTTNRNRISESLDELKILERRIASVASFDLGLPVQGVEGFAKGTSEKSNRAEITCPQCFKTGPVDRPKHGTMKCCSCLLKFEVSA